MIFISCGGGGRVRLALSHISCSKRFLYIFAIICTYKWVNGIVEVVGPDLLFLCPVYLVNNMFLYMNIYVGQRWWWWGQTCSISYFLLMGGRGWWTWAAPGLKWPIPAGLEEFEREVPFGNNSLPYMLSSSSFFVFYRAPWGASWKLNTLFIPIMRQDCERYS